MRLSSCSALQTPTNYEEYYGTVKNDECYDVTPAGIKEKYGYQIVKFAQSGKTILNYKDCDYELGSYFGGGGAGSCAIADLNSDGLNEVYYTSSWGSGASNAEAGYYDPVKCEVVKFEMDYDQRQVFTSTGTVLTAEDGVLAVYTAALKTGSSYVKNELSPIEKIAEIRLDSEGRIALVTSGISTH